MIWRELLLPYLRYSRLDYSFGDDHFQVNGQMIQQLKELDYIQQWRRVKEEKWYHLKLADHSYFLFRLNDTTSYSYLACPLEIKSLRDYLADQGKPYKQWAINECIGEYEEYFSTCALKNYYTPIRYDLDKNSYRKGVHPAAHVHIGISNNIRIGLRRELTPLAFFLFVIRQMYPINWEFLLDSTIGSTVHKKIRNDLAELAEDYYCKKDEHEHYLI